MHREDEFVTVHSPQFNVIQQCKTIVGCKISLKLFLLCLISVCKPKQNFFLKCLLWEEVMFTVHIDSQPVSKRSLKKRKEISRCHDEHYSSRSLETSPSFCNEREVRHQRRALHILWFIMSSQTHVGFHPSDFLCPLHCYFQD